MTDPAQLPDSLIALQQDLIRLARRLADSEAEAQDLTQETLFRLWQRQEDLAQVDDLRAYGRAALRNLYRASLRRMPMTSVDDAPEPSRDPDVFGRIAISEINSAIARLPRDQAALMRLIATGETSPRVLARKIGCPPGTIMSRLARARAQLRVEMGLDADTPVKSLM